MTNKKPFHLMTPTERTAQRIAENKAIAERVEKVQALRARRRAIADVFVTAILNNLLRTAPRMSDEQFGAALDAAAIRISRLV